jgi:pimeloyl-ACP methyl ester carboxylesterase
MNKRSSIFDSAESQQKYDAAYSVALSLWPVPYSEALIAGRFGSTHVVISGKDDSQPIVLFHPAGCGSVIWYRNIKVLSAGFKVFAVDTIGEVNRSTVTQDLRSQKDLLDWIEELLNNLHIDRADMVGNSFGGYLGALTAAYLPQRVRRLVLISPAGTLDPMRSWMLHFFPGYMTGSRLLKRCAYDWIWQGYPIDNCIAEMRMIASTCGIPKHPGPKVLTDEELRKIAARVLLLVGDHEVIYKAANVIGRAQRLITNLRAEVVPDGNHNAEYTAAEYVNKKVLAFLSE